MRSVSLEAKGKIPSSCILTQGRQAAPPASNLKASGRSLSVALLKVRRTAPQACPACPIGWNQSYRGGMYQSVLFHRGEALLKAVSRSSSCVIVSAFPPSSVALLKAVRPLLKCNGPQAPTGRPLNIINSFFIFFLVLAKPFRSSNKAFI